MGIPLADGAQDIPAAGADTAGQEDLKSLEDALPSIIPEKNVEIFGILNISGLSASTKTESSETFSTSQAYHHIGLGGELYPQKEREWYSKFSLQASMNVMRLNSQAYNGSTSTNDVTEFSFGANWHPTKLPSQTMEFIPYLHLSLNMGSVKSVHKPGEELIGGPEQSGTGKTNGFSFGFGYKLYTPRGFGVRAIIDYYIRSERYDKDAGLDSFTKTVSGPRFMIGLGYRF